MAMATEMTKQCIYKLRIAQTLNNYLAWIH